MRERIKSMLRGHPRLFSAARTFARAVASASRAWRGLGRALARVAAVIGHPWFVRDALRYRSMGGELTVRDINPQVLDKTSETPFDPHYFHQAVWAARLISTSGTRQHHDVGSSVSFVGMLTAFTNVHFIDLRPLPVEVDGLTSVNGTILGLPFGDASISSLSCLHVLEHIGLGRYGDPLDPHGSIKAAAELQRVVAPSGDLYVSVPVGVRRTQFNAHRIFAPDDVPNLFSELTLVGFAIADDAGQFHGHAEPGDWRGQRYACGMYHFRRD